MRDMGTICALRCNLPADVACHAVLRHGAGESVGGDDLGKRLTTDMRVWRLTM